MDITLNIGHIHKVQKTFPDNQAVIDWATAETNAWTDIAPTNNIAINVRKALEGVISTFKMAPDCRDETTSAKFDRWINSHQQLRTKLSKIILTADTPQFQFLKQANTDYPDSVRYLLTYFQNGSLPNAGTNESLIAKTLLADFIMPRHKASFKPDRDALAKLHSDYQARIKTLEGKLATTETDNRNTLDADRKRLTTLFNTHYNALTDRLNLGLAEALRQTDDMKLTGDESIKKINDTDQRFKSDLALKPAYKYWSRKAVKHRKKAKHILWGLIIAASLIFWALGNLLKTLLQSHATMGQFGETRSFLILAISLSLTTMLFWGARIATRIYLGNVHLANDADERAILIHTYLALNVSGQARDEDRALVLSTVFRPSTDGVVKDDAAPGFTPASFIAGQGTG